MSLKIVIRAHKENPAVLAQEKELRAMLEAAYNLLAVAEGGGAGSKQMWFGAYGATKSAEIDARVAKIKNYLGNLKQITFSCSSEAGSIASYNQKACEKVDGGPARGDANPTLILNAGFRMDRYSWGEKVCSIVHELTHMTIGTSDEKFQGADAYGAVVCVALAAQQPATAYKNADNWAYYIGSFYDRTVNKGNDWRYMTAEEVAQRPPLSP